MRVGTANYLVSEANGMYRSRDEADVLNPTNDILLPGSLLGRISTGAASAAAQVGNTGNATVGAITVASAAVVGVYVVEFLTATTFSVALPGGALLANGATGVAYSQGGLSFTITAGGTPMVAGDGFNITVTKAPGDFARHNLGASDGSETVAGILYEEVAPQTTALRAITRRDCEVNGAHLIYSAGATAGQIATANAALLALGIVVR
jgi:phage protein U